MDYLKIDRNSGSREAAAKAIKVLKEGGVIAYPTDTLYGLGVDLTNSAAVERLFYLKGRDRNKPISFMVYSIKDIEDIVGELKEHERLIAEALLPGKYTLLIPVRKTHGIKAFSELKKIGFRIPADRFCRTLTRMADFPISTTSLNLSKSKNVENIQDIIGQFGNRIDLIVDAGKISSLKGSTVIDLSSDPPTLLREGDVSLKETERKLNLRLSTNFSGKYLIMFVCSGNVCRSPMAQGILKKLLEGEGVLDKVDVISSGTLKLVEAPANIHTLEVANEHGVDLDEHLSQHVNAVLMREANIVIALAQNHIKYLRAKFPNLGKKVVLLKQWNYSRALSLPSIPDPIGLGRAKFESVYVEIEHELKRILPYLLKDIRSFIG
jgi:L-threonylcarbamoyladenylate synthase